MRIRETVMSVASVLALAGPARAALTPGAGFAVQAITAPGVVAGGVVKRGNVVFVGQGSFGAGLQQIVRLEAGRVTVIATGFGGLGGFDLGADGTLYVVDNCYTQDGDPCAAATTGDTVYAIPDALTRTTPIAAGDAEMLPAGSIPFAFDVLSSPIGLLVSDAVGGGAGRVVRIDAGSAVEVVSGLGFAGGLAFDDPSLYVANVKDDFSGEIQEFIGSSPVGALVDGLAGASGLAVDDSGDLLVAAFSSVLSVDAAGVTTPLAEGFGFLGDLDYDPATGDVSVLDFGVNTVAVICQDDDGDGVCDASCSDGAPLEDAKLSLDAGKIPRTGSLRLRATLRVDGGLTADPSQDGMILQLLDAAGVRVLDVQIPGGEGWKSRKKNHGWRFRDKAGARAVTDVKIAPDKHDDGVVRVSVRSRKHFASDLEGVTLPLRATVALDAAAGECGSSAFSGCETQSKSGGVVCE
jgi:hypothetical protein